MSPALDALWRIALGWPGAAWFALAFACGSLPLSVWVGRLAAGADIRRFGDGNPGAANVLRAAGVGPAVAAVVLDVGKGLAPVALALAAGAPWRPAVAVAPILGHAFSPWLGFRGGKGVATAAGVWAALLWPIGAIVPAALVLALYALLDGDAWTVMLAGLLWLGVLVVWRVDGWIVTAWGLQAVLLAWTHRRALATAPRVRPWLTRRGPAHRPPLDAP